MRHSPPSPARCPDAGALAHLLRLRLGARVALQAALLDALFACTEIEALDAAQRVRLAALLEARSDAELESIAWRGSAGRGTLCVQVEVVFDGDPQPAERQVMLRRLRDLLRTQQWPSATLGVRAVLVCECTAGAPAQPWLDSSRCSSSGR